MPVTPRPPAGNGAFSGERERIGVKAMTLFVARSWHVTLEMTKSRLLEALRAILVEEREAIRRLDSVEMERASDAKEAVLAELIAVPFDARGPLVEALAELHPELRHNMMLFVHAAAAIAEAKRRALAPQKLAS